MEPRVKHYHTHHHHYWVRRSSMSSQPIRWPQRCQRGSSEHPASNTSQQQDPNTARKSCSMVRRTPGPKWTRPTSLHHQHTTLQHSQLRQSAPYHVSASFTKNGKCGDEEHTHIHIYVPAATEPFAAVRSRTESSPDSILKCVATAFVERGKPTRPGKEVNRLLSRQK